jgi:predicted transcriptional regulator
MSDVEILKEFVARYPRKTDAADELGISIALLSQYLHGRTVIGAKLRERLRLHGYYSDEVRASDSVASEASVVHIEKIIERLKIFHGVDTAYELAQILGIAESTLSGWKSRSTIDYELIFSKCEDVNLNWLIYGEGEMRKMSYVASENRRDSSLVSNEDVGNPESVLLSLISEMIDRKLDAKKSSEGGVKYTHGSDGVVLKPISKKVKK